MKQKELSEKVKGSLIVKYGYDEFKATWEQIASVLDMEVTQATYHIKKLIKEGFLELIQAAERGKDGYWSPNIFKITHEGMTVNEVIHTDPETIFEDIRKQIKGITKYVTTSKDLIEENARLRQELVASQAREKRLMTDALALRQKLFELNKIE
jgi:DNA-binding Lrp family transcriptional regulator